MNTQTHQLCVLTNPGVMWIFHTDSRLIPGLMQEKYESGTSCPRVKKGATRNYQCLVTMRDKHPGEALPLLQG